MGMTTNEKLNAIMVEVQTCLRRVDAVQASLDQRFAEVREAAESLASVRLELAAQMTMYSQAIDELRELQARD